MHHNYSNALKHEIPEVEILIVTYLCLIFVGKFLSCLLFELHDVYKAIENHKTHKKILFMIIANKRLAKYHTNVRVYVCDVERID
jgi:hypothetical protein